MDNKINENEIIQYVEEFLESRDLDWDAQVSIGYRGETTLVIIYLNGNYYTYELFDFLWNGMKYYQEKDEWKVG